MMANLGFADDIALVASSKEKLQEIVTLIHDRSLELGLNMNIKKTVTMVLRRNKKEVEKINTSTNGRDLEQGQYDNIHGTTYHSRW